MKIVTHDSHFHTDDVFATATLKILYPDAVFTRTRDKDIIGSADVVFDVGLAYDVNSGRFDHHQIGGAGKRENGIPYASFGLIWKHFGRKLVVSDKAWEIIERKLVWPIDAMDNGVDISTPLFLEVNPYSIQSVMGVMNLNWKEDDANIDEYFWESVSFAKRILERELKCAEAVVEGEEFFRRAYDESQDKRVIILDKSYPFGSSVKHFPEILYVVYPRRQDGMWKVEAVRTDPYKYELRKPLPEEWGGKSGDELAEISGVADTVFCHRGLFMVVARSKEGAVTLAKKALDS